MPAPGQQASVPPLAIPGPAVPLLLLSSPRRPTFRGRLFAFFRWFKAPENIVVCVTAAAVLVLHILMISNVPQFNTDTPPKPQYIFDEAHYIPEALRFLHREAPDDPAGHGIVRAEHPPLSKWLIASGIFIFGDNRVGWRSMSILFGIASIFIFYFICRRLVWLEAGSSGAGEQGPPPRRGWARWSQMSVFVPVLATFLFASENMSFVQAHVALLDVFYLTFMLLGILFYLRGNYLVSGVFMGLSMLGKAMAVLAILGILVHWAVARRSEFAAEIAFTWKALRGRKETPPARSDVLDLVKFLVAIVVIWMALLTLLEYPVTYHWVSPLGRTIQMLTNHLSLNFNSAGTSTTGIATRPWEWLYYPGGLYYWYTPRYLGSIGWTVWALIMPSMAYLAYEVVRGRVRGHNVATFALTWFVGVYGLLVALELATARYMYHFYFYPAIPPVSLAIAWGAWRLWSVARGGPKTRVVFFSGLALYLLGTIATFIIMSPLGTNLIKLPNIVG